MSIKHIMHVITIIQKLIQELDMVIQFELNNRIYHLSSFTILNYHSDLKISIRIAQSASLFKRQICLYRQLIGKHQYLVFHMFYSFYNTT